MRVFRFGWLLFLISCTLHPPYERPCFEAPEDWRVSIRSEGAVEIDWWKQFKDPILDDLVDQTLSANPDLQVAIAKVDQYRAQLQIANTRFFPEVGLEGIAQKQKIPASIIALPSGTPSIYNTFGLLFKASYFVDLWGEVRSASEAAYHEWLSSVDTRRMVVLAMVSAVVGGYFELRQLDQQYLLALQTLKTREESLRLAQIRFELGLTSQLEVEQATVELKAVAAEVEQLQIAVPKVENRISILTGAPPSSVRRGLKLDELKIPAALPVYLPSEIVYQRPDVRAAEHRLIAANARIGQAKAAFFPQFNLVGGLGTECTKLSNFLKSPSYLWAYGSDLFQQVFKGGRLFDEVHLKEAMQQEALSKYIAAILTAFQEVDTAINTYRISQRLIEIQKERLDSLRRYLHLADLRYKEGETDYLTYLDAEREYFRGEQEYQQAIGNGLLSVVIMYQALGGPWVDEADRRVMDPLETSSEKEEGDDAEEGA